MVGDFVELGVLDEEDVAEFDGVVGVGVDPRAKQETSALGNLST